MLSKEQAQSLTRLVHLLRPAWNEEGVYAALGKVRDRDPFDVALASLRAAADEKAKTPGVIPSPGPHWNELEPKAPAMPRLSRDERRARTCAHCGSQDGCKPPAHDFLPLDQAAGGRTQAAHLARAELAQTRANLCSHGVPQAACRDHHAAATDQPKGGYTPGPAAPVMVDDDECFLNPAGACVRNDDRHSHAAATDDTPGGDK